MASRSETVQVMVRCRPLNSKEKTDNRKEIVRLDGSTRQVTLRNPKSDAPDDAKQFTFDQVFDQNSQQDHVFNLVAQPIIDSVMSGYNGTIFAYGQTGTGKTHTMEGRPGPSTQGIIPNAFDYIFAWINETSHVRCLVRASFLEIYNEEVRDLLSPEAKNHESGRGLELKETADRGVYVKDLQVVIVEGVPAIKKLLAKGNSCRSVGATLMNQDSSRSHSIFTITIECTGDGAADHVRVGKLNLVDLAGSERQGKTGATGDRLKEATKINLSLSALGNVISALVDGRSGVQLPPPPESADADTRTSLLPQGYAGVHLLLGHIPYRDSKLTRLLQDSLGGNTKTVMIANVGPADWNFDETLSTLRYANRAKNIKNKPKINEDPKDAMLREFQDEIAKLKAALGGEAGVAAGGAGGAPKIVYRQKEFAEEDMAAMRADIERSLQHSASLTGKLSQEDMDRIAGEAQRQAEAHKLKLEEESRIAAAEAARIQEKAKQNEGTLEEQHAAADQAKADREKMLKKLKMYESKIIQSEKEGGKSLVEIAQEKELRLQEQREELEKRRAAEAAMMTNIAAAEEAQLMKEKEYESLEQEVKDKTKKLKKLHKKFKEIEGEVEDMYAEWQDEKEVLMQDVRILHQQMRLKDLVIDLFVPVEETYKVMRCAAWDDDRELWVMDKPREQQREPAVAKRPVSASGLRRPTTDFTKVANAMGDLNPRFRSENILSLELDMPERTTFDYTGASGLGSGQVQEALNAAFADDGDVMFVGNDAFQNDYSEPGVAAADVPTRSKPQRTPSGRQRPSSARRKSQA